MRKPIVALVWTRRRLMLSAAAFLFLVLGLIFHHEPGKSLPAAGLLGAPQDDNIRQRVEELAKQYNTAPIDAKNDRVWKAIPGLNGIEVDVDASVREAQKSGGGRVPLVVKQIPPKVSLDQLGALPIYRGNAQKKQMSLMINVAWGTEYLPDMLNSLEQSGVKATFFLDGSWTSKNGDVAKEILQRGHEIGNHAYTHPDMSNMGADAALREISRTNDAIKRATGQKTKLFAPPGGAYNDATVKVAHGQGMRTILWTLDTIDWRKPPAAAIINRVLPKAENGALVLMHPTAPTREALPALISGLKKKGFQLVTVSELLDTKRPVPTLP
jgi:peptidoglycan-N-acetylglucosamine deacetylase